MAAGAVDERNPGSCSGPGDPARQHSFLYATAAKKEPAASERPTALTCFIFEEWPMFTQKRSAATICPASKAKTPGRRCWCAGFCMRRASAINCTIKPCPANPILFCQNTKLSFLYMAVSGMAMRAANTTWYPKPAQTGG